MIVLLKKKQREVIERIVANHIMATDLIDVCSKREKREKRLEKITENTVRSLQLVGGTEAAIYGLLTPAKHKLESLKEMVGDTQK